MNKIIIAFFTLFIILIVSCSRENVLYQNQWGTIFKKHGIDSACFELADNNHDQIYIYNLKRAGTRFSPASTFKIMNALIAFESNTAPDEKLNIQWDGIKRRPEWDKDMNMREAFKLSCVPYFQELARRIGKVEMQKYLDTIRYGNKNIGPEIDNFWLNDSLKISADEQVGLMKKLYFDKLPMAQRTQRIVRSLMLQEENENYKLYYKTGTRFYPENNGTKVLAWIVGFAEKKEVQKTIMEKKTETNYKPYFFAMNYETNDTTSKMSETRIEILKDILKERRIITP